MVKRIPTQIEIEEVHEKARAIRAAIDAMLADGHSYAEVCEYLKDREKDGLEAWDQSIYILNRLAAIERIEIRRENSCFLFHNRNTDQLIRLYKVAILYLRRLEFNMPEELQEECAAYIRQEQLSPFAVRGIIQVAQGLIHKDEIWERIVILMKW